MGMKGTTSLGWLSSPHLCCHRKQHGEQCHIYKQWTMRYVLAGFQTVPGGLVANGVRVPRSLHGFSQGVPRERASFALTKTI